MDPSSSQLVILVHPETESTAEILSGFKTNTVALIHFLRDINGYISNPPPIEPALINLAVDYVTVMKEESFNDIIPEVLKKAAPLGTRITKRDPAAFVGMAGTMFPMIPDMFIRSIEKVIINESIHSDSLTDLFDFVDVLVQTSVRYVLKEAEQSPTKEVLFETSGVTAAMVQIARLYPDEFLVSEKESKKV